MIPIYRVCLARLVHGPRGQSGPVNFPPMSRVVGWSPISERSAFGTVAGRRSALAPNLLAGIHLWDYILPGSERELWATPSRAIRAITSVQRITLFVPFRPHGFQL